jgi:hypothetical protein
MTGPRARDPRPGDPDYGEHLAKRIERCLLVTHGAAFIADRPQPRTIEVARAVVAMPEVQALLTPACTEPLDDEVTGELATASQYSDDPWLADRDRMQVVLDVLHERGMVVHRRPSGALPPLDTMTRLGRDLLS